MKTHDTRRLTLVTMTFLWTVVFASDKIDRPRYLTAYACEGSMLTIQCYDGHTISLIRANYGRFSISVCNEHGVSDWSVNCMSNRSFRVLQEKCSQQNSCSIQAATQVFGDPCPGTWKYLEAHYLCLPVSTTTPATTTKLIPPWLVTMTTMASDWLVPVTPSTRSTTPATKSSHPLKTTTSSTTTVTVPKSSTAVPVPTVVEEWTSTAVQQDVTVTTTVTPTTQAVTETTSAGTDAPQTPTNVQNEYCMPKRARGLQWDWTKKGEIAVIPCPGGASGNAKWRCGTNPVRWTPDYPDLSSCKSARISRIVDGVDQGQSVANIASALASVTKSTPLYGGDTITITSVLKKLASKMSDKLNSLQVIRKEEMIKELMQYVIETSSNLLDPKQRASWNDLSRREQMKAATSLLVGLEENAYLLADQVNYEKILVETDRNVMMSMKVYKVQNVKGIHFPTNEDLNNVAWDLAADSISLSVEAVQDRTDNGLVKAIFFTFSNLDELLQPLILDDYWHNDIDHPNLTHIVNTRVISATVGRGRHVPLRQPVSVTLRHLHEDNISQPICVFWNYDTNSWSDDGCRVMSTNRTHTVCSCNHLTNFAVLMNVQGIKMSPNHEVALQMITYIGCIISIVCLAFSFFTFAIFRGLKSDRNTIHKNLCACLLVAEVIFLLGIDQTDKRIVCGIVAGLLHFFFLCTFAWMFLEGFQIYVMLIEVFETEVSRIRWYYALAYGVPAFIVCISSVIDPFSYGTDRYCWLRTDNYFIFSFVGPVIAVIAINFLFLSVAIYMMCRHANKSASLKNKEQSKLANIRAWVKGAIMLVFLLGLTWTFGLLYLNQETIVMAYTFTILNSLQGLFIFIFHCVQNEKVQKEYKKLLRRSHCIATCKKGGSKDRRSSFYVNSNGTSSIPVSNSNSSSQQNNFRRLWKTQNGKTCSGHMSVGRNATLAGNAIDMFPDSEVEKGSSKSSNRDSGHGGSDREDSSASNHDNTLAYNRNAVDYGGLASDLSGIDCAVVDQQYLSDYCEKKYKGNLEPHHPVQKLLTTFQHPQHQQVPSHDGHSVNRIYRPLRTVHPARLSPHNHIYTDIDSRNGSHGGSCSDGISEPVYEEIEHHRGHETQVPSDLSDEDTKRRSDVSRQSSGSYGDSRPLIPQGHNTNNANNGGNNALERDRNRLGRTTHAHHHLHPHGRGNARNHQASSAPEATTPSGSPSNVSSTPIMDRVQPCSINSSCETPQVHGLPVEGNPPCVGDAVGVGAGGVVPQDGRYPSDNSLIVAMFDGRKVVHRLQPTARKLPNTCRTNSFSEC